MDTRFEQVWDRVNAGKAETREDTLDRFAEEERQAAEEYLRLAGSSRSAEARRLFTRLAAEEREHLKRLQAMAYLLQGSKPAPRPGKHPAKRERTLQALRKRYALEQESAEAYKRAAAKTGDERLADLFRALAADEQRHGEEIWSLLQKQW